MKRCAFLGVFALTMLAATPALRADDVKSTDAYKKAVEALKKVDEKVYSPVGAGMTGAEFNLIMDNPMMGFSMKFQFTWVQSDDPEEEWKVSLDTSELPPELAAMFEQNQGAMAGQMKQFGEMVIHKPMSEHLKKASAVEYSEADGKVTITVTTEEESMSLEGESSEVTAKSTLVIDSKTSLITSIQVAPEEGQGMTLTPTFTEQGGKTVLSSASMTEPQELSLKWTYEEVQGFLLAKEISIESQMSPEPQTFKVTDWKPSKEKRVSTSVQTSDPAALAIAKEIDQAYFSLAGAGASEITFDCKMPGQSLQGSTCSVSWKAGGYTFDVQLETKFQRFAANLKNTFKKDIERVLDAVVGSTAASLDGEFVTLNGEPGKSIKFSAKKRSNELQSVEYFYTKSDAGIKVEKIVKTLKSGEVLTSAISTVAIADGPNKGRLMTRAVTTESSLGTSETVEIELVQPQKAGDSKWSLPGCTSVKIGSKTYAISKFAAQ